MEEGEGGDEGDAGWRPSAFRHSSIQAQKTRLVDKPWGHELIWAHTDAYVGKKLHIMAGHQLSLQYHTVKEETVYVLHGRMSLLLEDECGVVRRISMEAGDVRHIAPRRVHRMIAVTDCDVMEVSTPHLDDVVRLDDAYGRTQL